MLTILPTSAEWSAAVGGKKKKPPHAWDGEKLFIHKQENRPVRDGQIGTER